ncbi:MAG: hypothetical protein MZV64_63740 [Ignavibacteriales bacterium]|nr:hypothetical protein [Ignavibacteriales bacterium]
MSRGGRPGAVRDALTGAEGRCYNPTGPAPEAGQEVQRCPQRSETPARWRPPSPGPDGRDRRPSKAFSSSAASRTSAGSIPGRSSSPNGSG